MSALRRFQNNGFTLVEVLAALVIVAIGMLAVIEAVSQNVSNTAYLRDKTLAHWIAMNRLAEVRLAQQAPKIDKSEGEVEFAGEDWRWSMEVSQTPVKSMRRIDIRVRREGAPERSSLATITGFHGSAAAPAGLVSTQALWLDPAAGGPGQEGRNPDEPRERDRDRDPENPGNPGTEPPDNGAPEEPPPENETGE